ncbi:hypothetical protein [Trichococcus pasteurii]|uniref:Uncharacterized protein n=1 Tax=Trichococcus pasteurii TaxID=43064 RepID=A0A1W1IKJ0_9LACT|nr:hypothetical protein [Trichococcus pasteurii]SFF13240.1 hypothetical protein SAMN04488086_1351 [Trichococcus pasteurii]SLM53256.1 Hypothetical protein TPAS_2984 [Trichococcus pasteurii]SLM53273.1 Hypothetical protein TPAS_3001 [Trichococcus pasteurii]SSB94137.1 Hypothetical protein TPAS_2984 [Trichococcus pasteurii]SSB94154.1 Hypothetical protein TPAS_3001 [Trichococcus pasteurii]
MAVTRDNVIPVNLTETEIKECVDIAKHISSHIVDRADLHARDYLERFINVLQGEIAEKMVINWLRENGKYVASAVDKTSTTPDLGHDLILKNHSDEDIRCSIKSSLSAFKDIDEIISSFTLATTLHEIREVNIQTYFWLNLHGNPRQVVPNAGNAAIIAWAGEKDFSSFHSYTTENRESPVKKLSELRSMNSLLEYIK